MIATNTRSWVTCPRPSSPARLRLFCFPYAGGGASIFRTWLDDLPPSIQICPIQLPGRESRLRESCFTRLEPLVQALVQALPPYLDMPYAFFGHSLGALIGFELARSLVRENRIGPVHLFVSSHSAPQVQSLDPPIHPLLEPDFIKELKRLDGTPAEVLQHAELMALLLPVLRADFAINETYVYTPGTLLDCPISAFGGLQDSLASRDGLAAWRDQTRSTFTLRMFPGNHFFLRSDRTLLLRAIVHDLTQSLGQSNASQRL